MSDPETESIAKKGRKKNTNGMPQLPEQKTEVGGPEEQKQKPEEQRPEEQTLPADGQNGQETGQTGVRDKSEGSGVADKDTGTDTSTSTGTDQGTEDTGTDTGRRRRRKEEDTAAKEDEFPQRDDLKDRHREKGSTPPPDMSGVVGDDSNRTQRDRDKEARYQQEVQEAQRGFQELGIDQDPNEVLRDWYAKEGRPNYEKLVGADRMRAYGKAFAGIVGAGARSGKNAIDTGTKLLGSLRRLSAAFLSPNMMSVPSALAGEMATSLGAVYDMLDKEGVRWGLMPGADGRIAAETPKGAQYYIDRQRAENVSRYMAAEMNKAIEQAVGPGGDPAQMNYAQFKAVHDHMDSLLGKEVARIMRNGRADTLEDKAIIEAYKDINKRMGKRGRELLRQVGKLGRQVDRLDEPQKAMENRDRFLQDKNRYQDQLIVMEVLGDSSSLNFVDDMPIPHQIREASMRLRALRDRAEQDAKDAFRTGDNQTARDKTAEAERYDNYLKRMDTLRSKMKVPSQKAAEIDAMKSRVFGKGGRYGLQRVLFNIYGKEDAYDLIDPDTLIPRTGAVEKAIRRVRRDLASDRAYLENNRDSLSKRDLANLEKKIAMWERYERYLNTQKPKAPKRAKRAGRKKAVPAPAAPAAPASVPATAAAAPETTDTSAGTPPENQDGNRMGLFRRLFGSFGQEQEQEQEDTSEPESADGIDTGTGADTGTRTYADEGKIDNTPVKDVIARFKETGEVMDPRWGWNNSNYLLDLEALRKDLVEHPENYPDVDTDTLSRKIDETIKAQCNKDSTFGMAYWDITNNKGDGRILDYLIEHAGEKGRPYLLAIMKWLATGKDGSGENVLNYDEIPQEIKDKARKYVADTEKASEERTFTEEEGNTEEENAPETEEYAEEKNEGYSDEEGYTEEEENASVIDETPSESGERIDFMKEQVEGNDPRLKDMSDEELSEIVKELSEEFDRYKRQSKIDDYYNTVSRNLFTVSDLLRKREEAKKEAAGGRLPENDMNVNENPVPKAGKDADEEENEDNINNGQISFGKDPGAWIKANMNYLNASPGTKRFQTGENKREFISTELKKMNDVIFKGWIDNAKGSNKYSGRVRVPKSVYDILMERAGNKKSLKDAIAGHFISEEEARKIDFVKSINSEMGKKVIKFPESIFKNLSSDALGYIGEFLAKSLKEYTKEFNGENTPAPDALKDYTVNKFLSAFDINETVNSDGEDNRDALVRTLSKMAINESDHEYLNMILDPMLKNLDENAAKAVQGKSIEEKIDTLDRSVPGVKEGLFTYVPPEKPVKEKNNKKKDTEGRSNGRAAGTNPKKAPGKAATVPPAPAAPAETKETDEKRFAASNIPNLQKKDAKAFRGHIGNVTDNVFLYQYCKGVTGNEDPEIRKAVLKEFERRCKARNEPHIVKITFKDKQTGRQMYTEDNLVNAILTGNWDTVKDSTPDQAKRAGMDMGLYLVNRLGHQEIEPDEELGDFKSHDWRLSRFYLGPHDISKEDWDLFVSNIMKMDPPTGVAEDRLNDVFKGIEAVFAEEEFGPALEETIPKGSTTLDKIREIMSMGKRDKEDLLRSAWRRKQRRAEGR